MYKTYRDRMVPLPPRSGNIELAENQEIEHDIQDYMAKTDDHAEKYEFKDYVMYLVVVRTFMCCRVKFYAQK